LKRGTFAGSKATIKKDITSLVIAIPARGGEGREKKGTARRTRKDRPSGRPRGQGLSSDGE